MKRLALAVVCLHAASASALPVDLRTLQSPAPRPTLAEAPRQLPLNEGSYLPGCEVLATRQTLNEVLATAERLSNEAWNLDADAGELWAQWRAFVPPPSGAAAGLEAVSGRLGLAPGGEEMRLAEVFRLHQDARLTVQRAQALMRALERTDAAWWKAWRALDAQARAGRDGLSLRPRLNEIKERLRGHADASNALDAALRAAQAQYDLTRPLMLEHLAARGVSLQGLRQPWHWNYAFSGTPRPDARYDFNERYDVNYEESCAAMSAGGGDR